MKPDYILWYARTNELMINKQRKTISIIRIMCAVIVVSGLAMSYFNQPMSTFSAITLSASILFATLATVATIFAMPPKYDDLRELATKDIERIVKILDDPKISNLK